MSDFPAVPTAPATHLPGASHLHPASRTAQSDLLEPQTILASPVARLRKTDIGWSAELEKWICRAVIHPPDTGSSFWYAYSKDIADCLPGLGDTEQAAIDDLKSKLAVTITAHLGDDCLGVVPLADITRYRPFGSTVKFLGVEAPAPVKPKL